MLTDFRDGLARLAGIVTPGVDDTPYIQAAIEAITRDRDTGYSASGSSSSDGGSPALRFIPDQTAADYRRYSEQQAPVSVPMPIPLPGHSSLPTQPRPAHPPSEYPGHLLPPLDPFRPNPQASADSLASTLLLKSGQRPAQPHEWRVVDRDIIVGSIGEQKAATVPSLNFRPLALRAVSLLSFAALCLAMIVALMFSAVYSERQKGLRRYESAAGGLYFVFRMLPQLLAAVLLLWAQLVISTMFRILPFVRLASSRREEREGALFANLYPKSFLWPQLTGEWNVWVPILVTWLANFTIPLQSSLFTVILSGDDDSVWTWATVQGVAWTLVALYLALLASTIIVWRYWASVECTGLIWDPRSLADILAIVSDTNTADDYRGTQMARTRDGIRFALRRRADDKLGYWTWKDGRPGFWYTLGTPMDNAAFVPVLDPAAGQRMDRNDEKQGGVAAGGPDGELLGGNHDLEAGTAGLSAQARLRYLPWCLRSNQLLYFVVTALVLLVAIFVAAFLPSTRIASGFLPWLPSGPQPGVFSPADFLYSFLPSLLGMVLFLLFQSLDLSLRVLQPWAALADPRGARAEHSLLADYAACGAPAQSALRALRNGHWRVAALSAGAALFVLVPVLAGGMFMALTATDGAVRIYPNMPAFSILLTLLVLYLCALASLLPNRAAMRLPHAVTCLAEIAGFLANDDLLADPAFKQCRSRDEMLDKMGVRGGIPDTQPRWILNVGGAGGGDGAALLGIRRARRFTEKRRVRKSQIKRGVLNRSIV
ncbi:hypothetical protein B0T26DRAFT_646787 [Lasiosphaeria miniovina]|uniref:Phosphoribosylaminoimidazole-succinocarboxamide synthase n=1 Tax=Lasiosphaeria miniovina TaxID=1954250 RepID=A0AA40AJW8_9PEZI|nr:uncharacterized protein B0T26DRAFT_646787 [Lasiosphaeria miniovina]KAK0717178.1 hypothetical protein B0T26DRAFT_646787 [Lasiosphaeria miniovina]